MQNLELQSSDLAELHRKVRAGFRIPLVVHGPSYDRDPDALRSGRFANLINAYWSGYSVLQSEIATLARESGLLEAGSRHALKELFLEISYSSRTEIDMAMSGPADRPNTYKVRALADGRNLLVGPDEERYWITRRAAGMALLHVAAALGFGTAVQDYLQRDLDRLPVGPAFPTMPVANRDGDACCSDDPFDPGRAGRPKDAFQQAPGPVWVMIRARNDDQQFDYQRIFSAIVEFVVDGGLGRWEGDSQGSGEADISFLAESQKAFVERVGAFLEGYSGEIEFRFDTCFSPFVVP